VRGNPFWPTHQDDEYVLFLWYSAEGQYQAALKRIDEIYRYIAPDFIDHIKTLAAGWSGLEIEGS
jgi:hypothetical protein